MSDNNNKILEQMVNLNKKYNTEIQKEYNKISLNIKQIENNYDIIKQNIKNNDLKKLKKL